MIKNGNYRDIVLLNVKIKLQGQLPEGIGNYYYEAYVHTNKYIFCFKRQRNSLSLTLKASHFYNVIITQVIYSLAFIQQHFFSRAFLPVG